MTQMTGNVIDTSFKKEFIQPLMRKLCEDFKAKRLTTNEILRKLISRARISDPVVFRSSVISEMHQQAFKAYAYRSYQFHCGKAFTEDIISDPDRSDAAWVKSCSARAAQCRLSSETSRDKSKSVRKSIKAMSAAQFANYCEGQFTEQEMKTLKMKCFKDNDLVTWKLYLKNKTLL